jgi:hypothetical protein
MESKEKAGLDDLREEDLVINEEDGDVLVQTTGGETVFVARGDTREEKLRRAALAMMAPRLLEACEAVLECDIGTEEGKAHLKVPARSLGDLGAQIRGVVEMATSPQDLLGTIEY